MITKRTRDLYFAAALSATGAKLENVDKTDERHMVFEFSPRMAQMTSDTLEIATLDLDYLEREWANKTLTINAVEYAEAIKRMKSVVHSSK